MRIRGVETADLPALQDIERAAGLCFGEIGMPEIAEYQPLPLAELAVYQRSGRAWLAVGEAGDPVAYLTELTPGLRAIRHHEAELDLDRWPRLCMRRDL